MGFVKIVAEEGPHLLEIGKVVGEEKTVEKIKRTEVFLIREN